MSLASRNQVSSNAGSAPAEVNGLRRRRIGSSDADADADADGAPPTPPTPPAPLAAPPTLPPQKQSEIKLRKKIMVCENCGRILVDADLNDSVVVK